MRHKPVVTVTHSLHNFGGSLTRSNILKNDVFKKEFCCKMFWPLVVVFLERGNDVTEGVHFSLVLYLIFAMGII